MAKQPDDFKIPVSDTQAYKQFGNSVVVPLMSDVARLVAGKMKELDSKTNTQGDKTLKSNAIIPADSNKKRKAAVL